MAFSDAEVMQPFSYSKIVSEYGQEIPQSLTADKPMTPRGRAAQPSRDTRKTNQQNNQLSLPHQDDCKTKMDIKSTQLS